MGTISQVKHKAILICVRTEGAYKVGTKLRKGADKCFLRNLELIF